MGGRGERKSGLFFRDERWVLKKDVPFWFLVGVGKGHGRWYGMGIMHVGHIAIAMAFITKRY